MPKEIWKKIPTEDKYEVSNLGNVRNIHNPTHMLKKTKRIHQYYFVASNVSYHTIYRLDKLVLSVFDKSYRINDKNLEVIHLDGDAKNCALDNLKAVTRNEKIAYWKKQNTYRKPKGHYLVMKDKDGNVIKEFDGYTQAVRYLQANKVLPRNEAALRRSVSRLFYYISRSKAPKRKPIFGYYWAARKTEEEISQEQQITED